MIRLNILQCSPASLSSYWPLVWPMACLPSQFLQQKFKTVYNVVQLGLSHMIGMRVSLVPGICMKVPSTQDNCGPYVCLAAQLQCI